MVASYVLIVAATAAVGFTHESTWTILLAAALSLPASVIALPSYYLLYGLLAFITNADPSGASGSTTCSTVAGDCTSASSGHPAVWFQVTTNVIGIVALTCGAILNVLLLRRMSPRGRSAPSASRPLGAS
ncbi:MAG: hypothetical protein WAW88_15770 [Nocardioides sp.]